MLSTTAAKIHVNCQFHLKRGEFLLTSVLEVAGEYTRMSFTSMDGTSTSETEVQVADLGDEIWNLTQCNFPGEHV
jgi:hypothetical protein